MQHGATAISLQGLSVTIRQVSSARSQILLLGNWVYNCLLSWLRGAHQYVLPTSLKYNANTLVVLVAKCLHKKRIAESLKLTGLHELLIIIVAYVCSHRFVIGPTWKKAPTLSIYFFGGLNYTRVQSVSFQLHFTCYSILEICVQNTRLYIKLCACTNTWIHIGKFMFCTWWAYFSLTYSCKVRVCCVYHTWAQSVSQAVANPMPMETPVAFTNWRRSGSHHYMSLSIYWQLTEKASAVQYCCQGAHVMEDGRMVK